MPKLTILADSPDTQTENMNCAVLGHLMAGRRPSALLISPDPGDEAFFADLFESRKWDLCAVRTLSSAGEVLRDRSFPVIITERDLPVGDWRGVLVAAGQLPGRPAVIITSRLADEQLWSEVLNLGGHDVLAKPFRESEVRHVLTHAWVRSAASEKLNSARPIRFMYRSASQSPHSGLSA